MSAKGGNVCQDIQKQVFTKHNPIFKFLCVIIIFFKGKIQTKVKNIK